MARKMHCAPQEIGNDNPKVLEARKDSITTIYQQQNKLTSVEDCGESSLSRTSAGSRCAVISFLNFEADGTWRVIALPVRFLSHINLASAANMDGLQLLFPPPVSRLKIDQCKGPRGPPPPYAYSAKPYSRRSITESNVHRRCQNKIANRASKLNELPGNSCSQSSSVCSSAMFPDNSDAVNSSDKLTSNFKADKSTKKNSRRKARKKDRQSKKQSRDSGSTVQEVLNEEYFNASLTSETCSSNDLDKEVGLMLYTTEPESSSSDDRLIKNDDENTEMTDNINVMEAPKSCDSFIYEADILKSTAPIIQNSAGEYSKFESKNQLPDRGPDLVVFDGEIKDTQQVELSCFNDIQDSVVLDAVSMGSKSDESVKAGDTGKVSNMASCKLASNSGDGYFLGQHNEGVGHGGQNCIGNDKKVNQKRPVSKSSSFNKFVGVGISHGRTGKENSHSIWQKVKKNSSVECGDGDLKKVNSTLSQFGSPVRRDPSVIRKSSSASENFLSKMEDKKQFKNKAGRKSKGKMDSISKREQFSYSRKGSHFDRSMLNDNMKVSVQQNDMPQKNNQQGLSNVDGFNSDINCLISGLRTNSVEQVTSELVHGAEFHLEVSDPQISACHTNANMKNENMDLQDSSLAIPYEHINQSNMREEQSLVSYDHLGDVVVQTDKEVSSSDCNVQNHSSGTTLWKWIPIVKKDTPLAKSESNSSSLEYSDAPHCKTSNLESNVEPKVLPFSQNQDLSQNASSTSRIYSQFSCLDKVGKQKLGNQVACTLTEHMNKHEVVNRTIYECQNRDTLDKDSCRIAQAVNDASRAERACKAIQMATGEPIAEIERLLHFCSPVICRSPNSVSCLTYSGDHVSGATLCRHEMPDLSLRYLWQWYEKHGSYGLEIRGRDYEYSKRLGGVDQFPFRAYFVPSLSAIQLFKNRKNQCLNSSDKFPNCKVSQASEMIDDISELTAHASQHPIFSVLFPQPRNQDASIQTKTMISSINNACNSPINSTSSSGDLELLFEYFELEQPQQRQPLYEKIQELVRGAIPIQSKTYGDPTKLDSINLRDLHPRSWYSVAWYPIYRIPDGNFRASFLTYHSLGHLVRRSANSDFPTAGSSIVSPAVGLQSYNAQGECWFQLKHSALAAETLGLNPSEFLKERLRTLEETASLMARAVVNKGDQICTNRHPDYEFFLSRRRY